MRTAAGVEHIGHQHGVVGRAHLDAAHAEYLRIELEILRDLQHRHIFKHRLEELERVLFGDLVRRDAAREQAFATAVAALPMHQRHVARLVWRDTEREAAQLGLHWVERVGFGIEGDDADIRGARDPGFQAVERTDSFVFRAVDLGLAGFLAARGSERLRRTETGIAGA